MSEKKRAAAAEIFRQQNLVETEAEIPEPAFDDLDDVGFAADLPPNMEVAMKLPARRPQNAPAPRPQAPMPKKMIMQNIPQSSFKTSEELQLEKGAVQVRETGFWWWRRVVVPPNVYVVHTRIGKADPVTIGMGISFRYNPRTDAYLVVPAAMQTIGIVSNCISQEKQGINVLAYVQWQISDFSVAYRKLDFSDANDPLAIVNAQLREQADAAIKDKIATMSVSEVLTDKAPIIEELTRRLIEVTEGRLQRGSADESEGLGITIVTVQIKEALVSSQRLWEHLQAPFRHEQERNARLSYLQMQDEIQQRERETRQQTETGEAETRVNIARVQQAKQTEEQEIRLEEAQKRREREQTDAIAKAQTEADTESRLRELAINQQIQDAEEERRLAAALTEVETERLAQQTELATARHSQQLTFQEQQDTLAAQQLQGELERDRQRQLSENEVERLLLETQRAQAELETEVARMQQETDNLANNAALLRQWIQTLPELAESLPEAEQLRVLQINGDDTTDLTRFIAQQLVVLRQMRDMLNEDTPET